MAILLMIESVLGLKVFQALCRDGFREAGFGRRERPFVHVAERKAVALPTALDSRYTRYIYKSYIL